MAELPTLLATIIPVLGRALLHFLWQGALIGLFAALALQLLRDARPHARYAVACSALLACVLVPTGGRPAGAGRHRAAACAHQRDRCPGHARARCRAGASRMVATSADAGAPAAGCRLMGCRRQRAFAAHGTRRGVDPPPACEGAAHASWQARVDALAQRFGLARPVALRLVDALDSPASAGWWRPVVLLPTALLARMPADLIEALLAHELAHVRRHDYLVNLMQGVVEALLFYHPVTWWLSRRIRIEREHIADQLAAEVTGAPRRLALALSALADLQQRFASLPRPTPSRASRAATEASSCRASNNSSARSQRVTAGRIAFPLLGLAAACIALYAQAQVAQPAATPAPVAAASAPARPMPKPIVQPSAQPQPPPRAGHAHPCRRQRDAYALVRKDRDGFTMSGSSDDIDAIEAARDRLDSDFLWFRRDDQAYVVVDPATFARAQAAWREVDRLSPQMEALGAQMEVHGDKLEVLGEKMSQLGVAHQLSPEMKAAQLQIERLAGEQQALAGQQMRLAADMSRADDAGATRCRRRWKR